jgi:hypothetical protein
MTKSPDAVIGMRLKGAAAAGTKEWVEEQRRRTVEGWDAKPVVWQEGDDFVMEAYFADEREAAEFAAYLTQMTGIKLSRDAVTAPPRQLGPRHSMF